MNRQFWLPVNLASLCLDLCISRETKQGKKEQFISRAPAEKTVPATLWYLQCRSKPPFWMVINRYW